MFQKFYSSFSRYKYSVLFFAGVLLFSLPVKAQLSFSYGTAADIAAAIAGPYATISSPVLTCHDSARGTFVSGDSTLLGMGDGIVLTTGNISTINGPASSFWTESLMTAGDTDLTFISGAQSYDACKFEFDVVAEYDTFCFKYVFASEEYPEYNCSAFNDIFGFFISGPGITGKENIALVPNTTIPVAINSINDSSASSMVGCTSMGTGAPFTEYYIDNSAGTDLSFDGYTTVLEAKKGVTTGVTYHLEMVVADISDNIFNTGVIIKGSSVSSRPANGTGIGQTSPSISSIGPNPFSNALHIQLVNTLSQEDVDVRVMNVIGRAIYEYKGHGESLDQDISAESGKWPKGNYYLVINVPSTGAHEVIKLQKL